jgi:predicted HicB family RNase H-like nuclease
MIEYKNFFGTVEYDDNAETFFGTVVNANAILSFRGQSVDELKQSFRDVVDTYLDECAREGIEPEKPYNGKIMLRISPELHRQIARKASETGQSMNRYIENLIVREERSAYPPSPTAPASGSGGRKPEKRNPQHLTR